jgi:superoxide dismutase, Cu-Zn family
MYFCWFSLNKSIIDVLGPHFNPHNATHGGPTSSIRHVGDLGNINTDSSGAAKGTVQDKYIKLIGHGSVIGRMIVVHAGQDDLGPGGDAESLKTGNAGGRAACGVIGVSPLFVLLFLCMIGY